MTRRSGFTLIELLVVISIIAILSTIGLAVFINVQKNARDAKRRQDLDAISKALTLYYNNAGFYPPPGNVGTGSFYCGITISSWSNCIILQQAIAPYMSQVPYDPSDKVVSGGNTNCGSAPCYYYKTPDNAHSKFYLGTYLENPPVSVSPICALLGYGNYCISNSL